MPLPAQERELMWEPSSELALEGSKEPAGVPPGVVRAESQQPGTPGGDHLPNFLLSRCEGI